ncbi:carbohydrate-binding protein [Kitasatospora purpeofusca]|uniref:carbohydrate-binding protein n=1 Tax=Kitasatospora purpeofusca TaxID=67352 RepID=UPI0036AB2AB5
MTTYAVDPYGKNTYGRPLYTAYDAGQMRAHQTGYGELQVTWNTPLQSATSAVVSGTQDWTLLRLVRNQWAVPGAEDDGLVCLEAPAAAARNSFADTGLVPGRRYYYALFVATPLRTWSSTAVYQSGDTVTLSGASYQCLSENTVGTVPGTDAAVWAPVALTATWTRCGAAVGLAAVDAGHAQILYDLIPRPYKVARVESTATSIAVNSQLYRFISMFGFHLDIIKAEHDRLLRMTDIERCSDMQLALVASQMGIDGALPTIAGLRRTYVKHAVEIMRGKGTPDALRTMVRALTGWDSRVQAGYNLLHDQDEAAHATPQYPPWDPATVYRADATLGTGDRVQYSGGLYQARGATVRSSGYLLGHAGQVATSVGPSALGYAGAPTSAYRHYLYVDGVGGVGGTVTVTLDTPPMGAGDYNLAIGYIGSPHSGCFDIQFASPSAQPLERTDLYAPEPETVVRRGYGRVTLGAGPSTLTFTVVDKNPFSHGPALGLDWIELTPYAAPSGIRPAGDSASADYWSALTLGPDLADTSAQMRNYTTGGFSTWNMVTASGAVNPLTATVVPPPAPADWWVSPRGASVGTAAPGPYNALVYRSPAGAPTGPVQISTCGWTQAALWTPGSESSAGAAVLWPDGSDDVWLSNSAYHRATPGRDFGWERVPIVNGVDLSRPDPWLVQHQAVPIRRLPFWRADADYNARDEVSWGGHRYEAALANRGVAPSGTDEDTALWRWLGSNSQQYTLSLHHHRSATGDGRHVRPFIQWLDAYGTVLATAQVQDEQQLLFDRFEVDGITYPTGGTPSGWTAPAAWQQGTGIPWSQNWGSWTAVDGTVHPVPGAWTTPSGTTTATALSIQRAGRTLGFDRSAVNAGGAGEQIYATFVSAPVDPAALGTLEHGIAFRLAVGVGYWLASRDRLTHIPSATNGTPTAYPSPGQTPTVVATWPTVPDGTRMRVTNTPASVRVEAMYPTGPGFWTTLANVSDSTHYAAQSGYGLVERVRQ